MKTIYFLLLLVAILSGSVSAQVSINTDNSAPAPSAMLDVKSTSKGFLPPRMTTAQRTAIANPEQGLTIFNTDLNCLEFYQAGTNIWFCPCLATYTMYCSSAVVNGIYNRGKLLNAANTITLTVQVTVPGGYAIRSKTINGCTFSATGTFTATGYHTVTLNGNGTPIAGGQFSYLLSFSNSAATCTVVVNVVNQIGSGTASLDFPFTTYYMDSRTQLLFTSDELAGLGYGSGVITAIGFNVQTFQPQEMNDFSIKMKNTSLTSLSGVYVIDGTWAYSGTYFVPGTGWQLITLQTPFTWTGLNLLIEICFNNNFYTSNTVVAGSVISSRAQNYMEDLPSGTGCGLTYAFLRDVRPDITFEFSSPIPASCAPITVDHLAGNVAPVNKTVTYPTITFLPGETAKCWITRNLGASQQATAVNDTSEASAGWYWQFNRKQGYMHDGTTRTPNLTWINDIDENSNWLTTNDPCNLELGASWRLPTYTEWYNVDNTGGWTTWGGPWGSGLRLHAAGNLSSNYGTLGSRGLHGIYRSSSQATTDKGWQLLFHSDASYMDPDYKISASSVRCLRVN